MREITIKVDEEKLKKIVKVYLEDNGWIVDNLEISGEIKAEVVATVRE